MQARTKKTGRKLQWVLIVMAAGMLGLSFMVPASLGDGPQAAMLHPGR